MVFSPHGKLVAGKTVSFNALRISDRREDTVLWDAKTGECRLVVDNNANYFGSYLDAGIPREGIVGQNGRRREAAPGGPVVGFQPTSIHFPDHAVGGRLIVQHHHTGSFQAIDTFLTVWDTTQEKPLRTTWIGASWPARTMRFDITPSGRILQLPNYNLPPLLAVPKADGTLAEYW
jgi:hypothetical protein